jgi:hypothetical protein
MRLDPVTTEALAALHVMEFCRDLGLQAIILEGNKMQLSNAFKAHEKEGQ